MIRRAVAALVALGTALAPAADDPLQISVYATAGGVNRYLATPQDRDQVVEVLRRFRVSRVFLEGRRGDEYVAPGPCVSYATTSPRAASEPPGRLLRCRGSSSGSGRTRSSAGSTSRPTRPAGTSPDSSPRTPRCSTS